jgi:geranylgeranyl reductase family protein
VTASEDSTFDVLVAGAGPAGATAAYRLAAAGLQVALLDRTDFPRPKLCGGLLTEKTLLAVERIFDVGPDALEGLGVLHHRSRRYRVSTPGAVVFEGRLDQPFWFADRDRYDRFFVRRAVSAGAAPFFSTRMDGFRRDGAGICARTIGGRVLRGRFLIGADGIFSRTRRTLVEEGRIGCSVDSGRAVALEALVPFSPEATLPRMPQLFFGWTRSGYSWIFPGAGGHLVGILSTRRSGRGRLRKEFAAFFRDVLPGVRPPVNPKGGALPFGGFFRRPGAGAVLLAGDAAGFADPVLGEGIFYAHRSAELAAEAVLACLSDPDRAADHYTARASETLVPELQSARRWQRLLYSLGRIGGYRPVSFILHRFHGPCEAAVQGRRSFSLFRKRNRATEG